jgi:hypothetical protein
MMCTSHRAPVSRFPESYPHSAARLRLVNAAYIGEQELAELQAELERLAAQSASEGEAAGFAMYDLASTWLRNIDPSKQKVRAQMLWLDTDPHETAAVC